MIPALEITYQINQDKTIKHQGMNSPTIFIDESGNAGLKAKLHNQNHPFFIVGFCYAKNPKVISRKCRKLLTKFHKKETYHSKLKEFKFYPTPALLRLGCSKDEIQAKWEPHYTTIRAEVANIICKYSDGVFAGVLDKTKIYRTTWTSERIGNYLINRSIYQNILPSLNIASPPSIVYDRGRLSPDRAKLFEKYVLNTDSVLHYFDSNRYEGTVCNIKEEDSLKTPGIWLADFVAGAFHLHFKYKRSEYYNSIESKFIGDGFLKLWD